MTVTPTSLTRAAGISAAVAGLLFIAVQINHPPMDVSSVTTTEWVVRQTAKTVMAAAALAGITGMYLRQVRQTGILERPFAVPVGSSTSSEQVKRKLPGSART
jgi:hypothetical protein